MIVNDNMHEQKKEREKDLGRGEEREK